jgi:prephenate dehydrogenase
MSTATSLSEARIAILGLGLMGGSLALALHGKCKALYAWDPDPSTVELASQRQIVDVASLDAAAILPASNMVVLAAPVMGILSWIERLPEMHPGSPIVLDLGSTKEQICQQMEALPARFDPLGGHPMCGKETPGLANAEAAIFEGAAFALVPLKRTTKPARHLAEQLVHAAGSHPVWVDPATHDRWVAATSHLPYLLSVCLTLSTPQEAAPLVGPGFRGITRLAASSVMVMLDTLGTNRQNILRATADFRAQLDAIESALGDASPERLEEILQSGSSARSRLVADQLSGASQ